MTDWIDKKAAEVASGIEDRDKATERENSIISQASKLFVDLQHAVEDAVSRINAPALDRGKPTNLVFSSTSFSSFSVVNDKSIRLFVMNNSDHFAVSRGPLVSNESHEKHEENIIIDLDDNEQIFMRTQDGQVLSLEAAVKYLLQPLLS